MDPHDTYVIDKVREEWTDFEWESFAYFQQTQNRIRREREDRLIEEANRINISISLNSIPAPFPLPAVKSSIVRRGSANNNSPLKKANYRLSDLVDKFLERNVISMSACTKATVNKYRIQLELFIELLENSYAHDVDIEKLESDYIGRLFDVPVNWAKRKKYFDGKNRKSIARII